MKEKKNLPKFLALSLTCLFLFSLHAIQLTALAPQYTDNWDTAGSIYDSIFWEESSCPAGAGDSWIVIGMENPLNQPIAYCVNNNRLDDGTMDFCLISESKYTSMCSGSMPATYVTGSTSGSNWYESDELISQGEAYQDVTCGIEGNLYSQNSPELRRGQIQYFRNNSGSCDSAGVSANSASYNYYIIDSTYHSCPSDGASSYYTKGSYGTGSVDIELTLCSTGTICDSDHDAVYSYNSAVLPANPCRLEEGEECAVSDDCWNNLDCDGAKTRYRGLCDGDLVDISTLNYPNSCGDIDAPPSISSYASNQDCTSDGGFPSGYICDDIYDNDIETSVANVFNIVCKAGQGVSCTVDSDCHHDLECVSGTCEYTVFPFFTTTIEDGRINKSDTESFDNSLSDSSDNNIQYACWSISGTNIECDGDIGECTTECSGASFDSTNELEGFTYQFNSGGNYNVVMTIGSTGKYSGTYDYDVCVSGDGTYCYSCFDGFQNDDETAIDWGGHCGFPYFQRCNNGQLDVVTSETSIDYGGVCGSCSNTTKEEDDFLNYLIESGTIVYPFDNSQCADAEAETTGIIAIVLLLSGVLLTPFAIIIIILLVFLIGLIFSGTGIIVRLLGRKTKNHLKKRYIDYKMKRFK